MTHLQRSLIVLSILVTCSYRVYGEEAEEETKKAIRSDKAKIRKSTTKVAVDKQGGE
jgi:hypothetical protein